MNYRKLSTEELKQYPYPNLIAEWIASGYSVCTLGRHMGLPGTREEDDQEMQDKLYGRAKIMDSEAIGLSRLFGVSMEYLFSHDLSMIGDQPGAYVRQSVKDYALEKAGRERDIRDISYTLEKKPYLICFVKAVIRAAEEAQPEFIRYLKKSVVLERR